MAKAKPAAAKKGNSKPGETLVVGSKVKAALKAAGCNTGGDVIDTISSYVGWIVDQAAKRANANGRKTVRGYDVLMQ